MAAKKQAKSSESVREGGRRSKPEPEREEDINVRLKPILGIAPPVYVPAVYGFLILLIVFLVFVLPGLRRPGSNVTFRSVPSGAAVTVDGTYLGATPLTSFVEGGMRRARLELPRFPGAEVTVEVPAQVFGATIFPQNTTVSVDLGAPDASAVLRDATQEFSRWAFSGSPTADAQFPPSLSERFAHLGAAAASGGDHPADDVVTDVIAFAAEQSTDNGTARDLVRGSALLLSHGAAFGPAQISSMLQKITQLNEESQLFAAWLAENIGFDAQRELENSDWFQGTLASYAQDLAQELDGTGTIGGGAGVVFAQARAEYLDIGFVTVPTRSIIFGGTPATPSDTFDDLPDLPYRVRVPEFQIMEAEVSQAQFAAFLADQPEWSRASLDALIASERAGEEYLDGFFPSTTPDLPVTNVSYHAAQAFADRLNSRVETPEGYVFRLPTEEEYEAALDFVLGGGSDTASLEGVVEDSVIGELSPRGASAGSGSVKNLVGNVWEWTGEWYSPARSTLGLAELALWRGAAALPSGRGRLDPYLAGAMVAVRGGSFANSGDPDEFFYARGAQPASWSTPYLGFRVVLARE